MTLIINCSQQNNDYDILRRCIVCVKWCVFVLWRAVWAVDIVKMYQNCV